MHPCANHYFGLVATPPRPLPPELPLEPAEVPLPADIPPPPRLAEEAPEEDDIPVLGCDIPGCIAVPNEGFTDGPSGEACLSVTGPPRLAPRAVIPPGASAYTGMLADPCFATLFDTSFKSPSEPRGTPSPAEFFWNTKFPGCVSFDIAIGAWFASTIEGEDCPATRAGPTGRVGACNTPIAAVVEATLPVGANPVAAILFNPIHDPPGCHPHPKPG